ncbi:caspase family protein [uncultured Roseobacter sp.]|uniref:caspase family protein n=1 Tax=uncultured Roseobacter sp. TaxID=114847 RepID=UPI00262EAE17|nr:caspase family protein [uncultured Roseobacter sp.]
MTLKLDVQSSALDDEALSKFLERLNSDLNETAGVSSTRATRLPATGERALELLLDPQLWIEVGQSAAVSALVGVLKAYVLRERSVSFQLRAEDGAEVIFNAKNFSEKRVFDILSRLTPGFAEAPTSFDEATKPEVEPVRPFEPGRKTSQARRSGQKTAIVIGMDRFKDPELEDLSYARNDATALHNLLQGETGEQFDHVELITKGNHMAALTRIEEITAGTRRDDLVLVYYAGHGLVRNQKLHLAFADTRAGLVHSTAMKYGNLLDVIEQAPARARLVILDCCYAGAAGEEAPRSALGEQLKMELGASSRTLVMTSATSTQVAREEQGYRHGVFTKHLLDGLKGAADRNGDGSVDTRELFDYLEEQMQAEHLQKPQKFNFSGIGAVSLRKTGLHPHRDLARRMRKQVNDLQHDGTLSEGQSDSLNGLLKLNLDQMNSVQRRCFQLLQTHLEGDFKPGLFFDEWDRLVTTKRPQDDAQKKHSTSDESPAMKLGRKFAHIKAGTSETISSTMKTAKKTATQRQSGDEKTSHHAQSGAKPEKRPWGALDGWSKFMRVCSYIGLFFVGLFVLGIISGL